MGDVRPGSSPTSLRAERFISPLPNHNWRNCNAFTTDHRQCDPRPRRFDDDGMQVEQQAGTDNRYDGRHQDDDGDNRRRDGDDEGRQPDDHLGRTAKAARTITGLLPTARCAERCAERLGRRSTAQGATHRRRFRLRIRQPAITRSLVSGPTAAPDEVACPYV